MKRECHCKIMKEASSIYVYNTIASAHNLICHLKGFEYFSTTTVNVLYRVILLSEPPLKSRRKL